MNKSESDQLKIRRVLLSVSKKDGLVDLARAFAQTGAELVATGQTAQVMLQAGLKVIPIEQVSGSPEAFQGRMKTLSYHICSGILYRRGDEKDEADLKKLQILPIDAVVVNFYPFEETREIEKIDIGGPTLVRAAAKNSPDVLVLTDPAQYSTVIQELQTNGTVSVPTVRACAAQSWDLVSRYDQAIAEDYGALQKKILRYGENPHQKASLRFEANSPIAWDENLTTTELSYNNILDTAAGYDLVSELKQYFPDSTGVVIIKHNNPCGVAWVPRSTPDAQKQAFLLAWAGDPTSAFGSVVLFTDPIGPGTANLLGERFVELVAAPELEPAFINQLRIRRKNLKAVRVRRYGESPTESTVRVPGGFLCQTSDRIAPSQEELRSVTLVDFPSECHLLARFGIAIGRVLKSNAITLVREVQGAYQLVGAGQGQPNRVDALRSLAIPRARATLSGAVPPVHNLATCLLISDAFFPFRDTVDFAHEAGIRMIVQPGGSVKDQDSIQACNENGIAMVFTGIRHFKH